MCLKWDFYLLRNTDNILLFAASHCSHQFFVLLSIYPLASMKVADNADSAILSHS